GGGGGGRGTRSPPGRRGRPPGPASSRAGPGQRLLDVGAGVLTLQKGYPLALAVIDEGGGHDAAPLPVDAVDEGLVRPRRACVDRERRPARGHEVLEDLAVRRLVDGGGKERDGRALPGEGDEVGELLHARLAPGGPQGQDDRAATVGGHRATHGRSVHLAGQDGGQEQESPRHRATRLIVQPKALVSATGTARP